MFKLVVKYVTLTALALSTGYGLGVIGDAIMQKTLKDNTFMTEQELKEIPLASPSPAASPKSDEIRIAIPVEQPKHNSIDIIKLGSANSVTLRGPIMEDSVASLQRKLIKMSTSLKSSDTIYLVIDSPGGSVMDGMQLIDTIQALPQKVKTITIFSASMAFQVVQNLDERMITPSGTLMSHRAKVGGIGGEVGSDGKGEFFSEVNWLLQGLKKLDHQAAARMSMSDKDYLDLIRDEYWISGTNAIKDKAADKVVLVRCSKELINGQDTQKLETIFGTIRLTYSDCPMIQSPLSIDVGNAKKSKDLDQFIRTLTHNETEFVKQYVVTGEINRILK